MKRTYQLMLVAVGASLAGLLGVACESDDSSQPVTGNGGAAGSAGSDAASNSDGTAGSGGAAGSGGTVGTGGTAGVGGTAGLGGTAGASQGGSAGDAGAEAGVAGEAGSAGSSDKYFQDGEQPYGKSFADWGDSWWKWVVKIPSATNPLNSGDCAQGQTGDVWFLAGTTGGDPQTRTCTVPANQALFFPTLNAYCISCPETEGCGTPKPSELVACAGGILLGATPTLTVELDGVSLGSPAIVKAVSAQYGTLLASTTDPLFDCMGLVQPNNCQIPEGDRPFASAGWWTLLKPLTAGSHVLHVRGDAGGFVTDVTYNLTISP